MQHSKIRPNALRTFKLWMKISPNPYKWVADPLWPGWYLKIDVNGIINRWKRNPSKFEYFSKEII